MEEEEEDEEEDVDVDEDDEDDEDEVEDNTFDPDNKLCCVFGPFVFLE